ncbi:hypothetical protein WJX77_008145 [Trebouxia sp. C0004]
MPGSTKFVRQHFYETVEHKATNRQLCAVPHQAPQRERVSLVVRGSVLLQSTGDAVKTDSSWKRKIKGNNLESVPRLLWLLEPKIVFAHAKASCRGQHAESQYCQGMFFEGYHRGGGRAHGVYEGTYWDLLANIGELTEALTQMAVGPTVLEEPVLQLPPPPTLPSWDTFKPVLQPLPPLPQLMEVAVRLPPFKPPKVAPVEYEAPQLLPLPDLLDEEEEVVPALVLPDGLKPKGLGMQPEEIAFDPPLPPCYPLQPAPPPYDKPVYGADWTGLKPFQEAEPVMAPDAVLPVLVWQHPPATLPTPPRGDLSRPSASSSASLARMIGGLALAGTTAAITDHPNSPRAPPASALGRRRGVASGVQLGPSASSADGQELLHLQEAHRENGTSMSPEGQDLIPASAGGANDGHAVQASQSGHGGTGRNLNEGDAGQQGTRHSFQNTSADTLAGSLPSLSQGDMRDSTAAAEASTAARPGSNLTPMSTAVASGSGHTHSDSIYGDSINSISGTPSGGGRPIRTVGTAGAAADLTEPSSIAAYRPGGQASASGAGGHLTEAQTVRLNPGPSSGRGLVGVGVGPSSRVGQSGGPDHSRVTSSALSSGPSQGPAPEFVQPYQEPLPPREALAFHPLPVFERPAFQAPAYAPPCAPRPIGFLAGYAPLLMLDMSGTMHPSKGGRFFDMKACALELLKPTGELAAVASGFDVIAFSSAPTSWAACYEGHLTLLEGASRPLVGRQNGRRAYRPNSANTGCMRLQKGQSAKLVPAEPGLLAEASRWVDSWQEPTGHTNYDAALQMAERYLEADCEYIFSDGLSDYAVVLLEKLRKRVMQGERVPVIHTVGFFAEEQQGGPGERFLRQLSALTGGTFQEYRPEVWRVWSEGEWVEYDLARETAAVKAERRWSEAALQAQRRNNARLFLEESFLDIMSRLPKLHALRVAAEAAAYEQEAAVLQAAHEAECAIVRKLNADIQRRSDAEYYRMTEPVRTRNEVLMAAAQQQHDAAKQQWQTEYSLAVMEWESLQEVSTPALQQKDNNSKAKLPRLATLQPEDSAEQLSNSAMPGRQATSATAGQLHAQAPEASAGASRSDAEVKLAQRALHRDSHAAAAAADHLRPLDQPPTVPGSGTALQLSNAMLEQKRASGLESAQTGVDTSSGGFGGIASSTTGEQGGGGSVLGQSSRQLSCRQQLELEANQSQQPGFESEQAQHQHQGAGFQQSQQAEQKDMGAQQAQQEELEFEQASDSSELPASSSRTTAPGQGRRGESLYAARDLTVLEQYEEDVVEAYASSFLAEAMMQQVLPATANAVVAEQHQQALAEVRYRNALNKQHHLDEVKAERAAWEEHEANIKRWKATKADLEAAYANELSEARASHQQHVARIRRQWEKEQKVLQAEYNRRVAIERAQHEVVCEPVRQRNAEQHQAAGRRREQQRHIQKANDDLVSAAEQLHQQRLYEAQAALSGHLVVARQQHADVCMQLQKEHAALQQAALQEHAIQKAVVARWNDQATLEARGRFSGEVSRLQKAHVRACEGVQAQHNVVCDRVRKHNGAIWPQVSIAQAAQGELHRVERFIQHIRVCAEKMEIGVNYVPETPNLDRVVEMSALTEALHKAFPDLTPDQYPWPNTQDGGAGGASKGSVRGAWLAPPKTRTAVSSAQQALDRIRQAALPTRPQSASRVRHDSSQQQVASVPQASDSSWCSHITTYTTTTHSGATYRPLTTSSRPSTAHPATPRAAHHGSRPRPASAQDHTSRLAAGHVPAHSPGSSVSAAAAVLRMDSGHIHVTQLVHSKGQQQSGFRCVSPISGGSTGATPSPAQTPCSVLSRPSTAGQRRGYQPARKAFDAAEISNCLQRHKLASMYSLR